MPRNLGMRKKGLGPAAYSATGPAELRCISGALLKSYC